MTLKEFIAKSREIEGKASLGKWKSVCGGQEYDIVGESLTAISDQIVSVNEEQAGTTGIICCCIYPETTGLFIAHSRNVHLKLLEIIEVQAAALEFYSAPHTWARVSADARHMGAIGDFNFNHMYGKLANEAIEQVNQLVGDE